DFHVTGVQTCALPIWISICFSTGPQMFSRWVLTMPLGLFNVSWVNHIAHKNFSKKMTEILEQTVPELGENLFVDFGKHTHMLTKIGRASCRERVWING